MQVRQISQRPAAASRRLAPAPEATVYSSQAQRMPRSGSGPGQRDHGEPGVRRSPLAHRCRGLEEAGRGNPPSGHSEPPGGGRPRRSAPLSLALLQPPWPTWRTLKLHCRSSANPSHSPHTASRSGAGTRGGGRRLRGRAPARSALPPTPGARPRSPAPGSSAPAPRSRADRPGSGRRAGHSDAGDHGRPPRPARPPSPRSLPPAPLADEARVQRSYSTSARHDPGHLSALAAGPG